MIDVATETLIPISALPAKIPGRPHISTIHRWRLRGIRGIKLETVLIGGRRFTSDEALVRFSAATTAAADGDAPRVRTLKQRERAIAAAERELLAAAT